MKKRKKKLSKIFFLDFFEKNRVRWKFNTVFGLEKTTVDRIPRYRRTALKEECLYWEWNADKPWCTTVYTHLCQRHWLLKSWLATDTWLKDLK